MGDLFTHIFDGLAEKFKHELMLISQQFPFEPIKYHRPSLRISFQEGNKMLNDAGIPAPPLEVRGERRRNREEGEWGEGWRGDMRER
jgi:hypothetical protein